MTSFSCSIVTPEGAIFHGDATSLIAPGADGYLGVWANHTPLISAIEPGSVTLKTESDTRQFTVGAGVLEVSTEEVSLLVESAADAEEKPAESGN